MELINALTVPDRDIRRLYKQAFPANERAPYTLLKRRAAQGKAEMWRLMDAEKWAGIRHGGH